MQLTNQKRLAASILDCGVHRVWVHPSFIEQVATAVRREDVQELIEEGVIKARPMQGTSRVRARQIAAQRAKGRRSGHGKRRGSANVRNPRKKVWMKNIRAQRRVLRQLRESGAITATAYRRYYLQAKGGVYRNIAHMKTNLEQDGVSFDGGA